MACRDILCVLGPKEELLSPAIHQGLAFAQQYGACLNTLVLSPNSTMTAAMFDAAGIDETIEEINRDTWETAKNIEAAIIQAGIQAGISQNVEVIREPVSGLAVKVGMRARASSVGIIDRPDRGFAIHDSVFEELLFSSGHPVVVAVPEKCAEKVARIVVAWNGTTVSARAFGDAISLFPNVAKVDVLCVESRKSQSGRTDGEEVVKNLNRCGIDAEKVERPMRNNSVAAAIDQYAVDCDADLVALGGFGHSRLREFILGGVTNELTSISRVPLLFSH